MTINQIRYFLEVAACLNFSEASRRLFMTQPALGRQITALETELNMQLFHRSTHGLKMTPAGIYLQKQWRELIENFDKSVEDAGKISAGYSGKLAIGVLEGINISLFLTDLVAEFEEKYPNIRLSLQRCGFRELRERLFRRELDTIITYEMDIENFEDIASMRLIEFHPAWAVPYINPLSKKDSVSCIDFKDQELLITDEGEDFAGKQVVIQVCREYGGFYPKLFVVDSVEETLMRLETGNRCALLNMELNIAKSDKVKMFPASEKDRDLYFSMGWLRTNRDISLDLFRHVMEKGISGKKDT